MSLTMAKSNARQKVDVPLEIEVTNFGPISKGKFRLKPLTVFVGPNNSGKTFAAMLAHSAISLRGEYEPPLDFAKWVKSELKTPKFKALVSEIDKLIKPANSTGKKMPRKYVDTVRALILKRYLANDVPKTVMLNFGTNLRELIRIGHKSSTIKIKYHINANMTIHESKPPAVKLASANIEYSIKNVGNVISIYESNRKIFGKIIDPNIIDLGIGRYMDILSHLLKLQKNSGLYCLLSLMKRMEYVYQLLPASYYLPAARSGILSAHQSIVSSVVKNARFIGTAPLHIEPISGVVSDYIDSLVRMSDYGTFTHGKNKQEMFKELFGGSLEVLKPKAGLPRIVYRLHERNIPLNLLSSSITETASLQLFLQDKIPRTRVLVLEEPEAHLHPENQAKLAKHVVRLVNSGVYVLLITHGVYFLEQLSMLVRMSRIPEKERKTLGYSSDDCLDDENVAPYLFKKLPAGGYTIHDVAHSPDDGISQDEFGRITDIMHNKELHIDRTIGES